MWAHVLIDPIRSEDGQLVGYAKITRDLSERKATQVDALKAERADLPVILASGYAELPEDRLTGIVRLGKPFEQVDLARALVTSLRPEAEIVPFRPKRS